MAKRDTPVETPEDTSAPAEVKVKVSAETLKQARLLFEIAGLYRAAGSALKAGDDVAYARASNLIAKYQDLFNMLATATAENITAEGLAAIAEM